MSLMTAVLRIASARDVVGHLDVGQRLHVEGLDRVLGDHAGLAVLEESVVVRERVDRDLVDARLPHLLARELETSGVALACHASIVGCWRGRRTLGGQRRSPRPRCATRCWPPGGGARSSRARPTSRRPSREVALAWAPVRDAATVAAYVSVGSEPGTGLLLDALVAAGKRVLVPVRAARPRPRLGGLHRSRRPRPRGARPPRADRSAARRRRDRQRRRGPRPGPRGLAVRRAARAGRRVLRPRAGRASRPGPPSRWCCTTTRSGSPCRPTPTTCRWGSR